MQVKNWLWVISCLEKDKYRVTLGDPMSLSAKEMFLGTQTELKDWLQEQLDVTMPLDHVVDTTGLGLIPDTLSVEFLTQLETYLDPSSPVEMILLL